MSPRSPEDDGFPVSGHPPYRRWPARAAGCRTLWARATVPRKTSSVRSGLTRPSPPSSLCCAARRDRPSAVPQVSMAIRRGPISRDSCFTSPRADESEPTSLGSLADEVRSGWAHAATPSRAVRAFPFSAPSGHRVGGFPVSTLAYSGHHDRDGKGSVAAVPAGAPELAAARVGGAGVMRSHRNALSRGRPSRVGPHFGSRPWPHDDRGPP